MGKRKTSAAAAGNNAFASDDFAQACFCNLFGGSSKYSRSDNDSVSSRDSSTPAEVKAEAALVKELNNLSTGERQKVYEDLHGISDAVQETPELLQVSLRAVETELRKSASSNSPTAIQKKKTYAKATFLRPHYFQSLEFMLPFLRVEEYHPKKTASRILDYLQLKLELFGWDGLATTSIDYDTHLTEGAKHHLATGRVQFLPQPDRSGRPVLVVFPKIQADNYDRIDGLLAYWWLFEWVKQKCPRGIVMILYDTQLQGIDSQQTEIMRKLYFDMNGIQMAARFLSCAPVTFTGIHFCYDNPQLATPMYTFQAVIGQRGRVRFRAHCASPTETLYTLMTFGITTKDFPVNPQDNTVLMNNLNHFIQERRNLERQERQRVEMQNEEGATLVMYPHGGDVLLGRGRPYQEHPGNQHLSELVREYWATYQRCTWKEKMELTTQIVEQIKSKGGRFLKKVEKVQAGNEYCWTAVEGTKAREKVSHAFRNNTVQRKEGKSSGNARSSTVTATAGSTSIPVATVSDLPLPIVTSESASIPNSSAAIPGNTTHRVSPPLSPTSNIAAEASSSFMRTTTTNNTAPNLNYYDNTSTTGLASASVASEVTNQTGRASVALTQSFDGLDLLNDSFEYFETP